MCIDLAKWTDEACQAHDTTISKQLGHLSYTTNVFLSILWREAEIIVQTVTNVVTIQGVRWDALANQELLQSE